MSEPPRNRLGALAGAVRAWLGALPRAWLVIVIAAAAAGVVAVALAGYTVYDFTMNNPAFCRSCHIMEAAWNRWSTSEHRKVDCHSCHEQSITESARQVITFVVRHPERVGKHADVPSVRCATCHESGDPAWRQVAQTAGHQVHADRRGIQCVVCHSTAVHRIQPVADICANCHQSQARGERAIKVAGMADFHCVDCHQFLRVNSPLRPTRDTCLTCHQGLPTTKTVGWPAGAPHTGLACSTCHRPHEKAQPIVTCTSCHTAPNPAIHPRDVVTAGGYATCATCHQPHRWRLY